MDGPNLSGQLPDWTIDDLLQIMQVTKKTGSLDIEGERRGRVHFVDGAVTGAELSGDNGSYQGSDRAAIADILYVLSTLESGTFGVGVADGPDTDGYGVEDIMDEVSALRSLEGEVIDAGLFEAPGVRLVGDLDEPMTIEADDWRVLVSLIQPFTFDFLESRVGRGGAVRILHTLHRLGVVETITGDDETEWLDRLAGDLASSTSRPMWVEEITGARAPGHVSPGETPLGAEPEHEASPEIGVQPAEDPEPPASPQPMGVRGVSADASTTLTDGVYDEIRRLRSKVSDDK